MLFSVILIYWYCFNDRKCFSLEGRCPSKSAGNCKILRLYFFAHRTKGSKNMNLNSYFKIYFNSASASGSGVGRVGRGGSFAL